MSIPEDFLLGAATAASQIEGAAHDEGRGPSIQDTFGGRTRGHPDDAGDEVADHYSRLDADLDLMRNIGLEHYRFSIAWSRVQPGGRGDLSPAGVAFYARLVDGLLARGIRPAATLYHGDLPHELEDAGGWPMRDTAERFAEYAARTVEALGDRVAMWTTFDEPWSSAFLGYGSGAHAPGRTNGAAALAAMHHLSLAHGLAVPEIRQGARNGPQVSTNLDLHVVRPGSDDAEEAVRRIDALANRSFTGPLLRGAYPDDLLLDTAGVTDWTFVRDGDLAKIAAPLDVLGVIHFATVTVADGTGRSRRPGGSPWPGSEHVEVRRPDAAPDALEELLLRLTADHPETPLLVTGNPAQLAAAIGAREAGADVRGFFAWSLLDGVAGGLERGDGSAKRYAEIIRSRQLRDLAAS